MLYKYLNNFYLVYLDNVLIYSERKEDYIEYYLKVLYYLCNASLFLNINKYEFSVKRVKYFSIILLYNSLEIDPNKVAAVLS